MKLFLDLKASRRDYGSQFEILVSLLYHELVRQSDYVIDGGANAGLHAVPLAKHLTDGHLKCFEPNPKIVLDLIKNLADASALNRCSVHVQALGDRGGVVEFLVDEATPALSHIRFEASSSLTSLVVPVVTLDSCVGDNQVAFMKLDLEGADFLALKGSRDTLMRSRPIVVFENSRDWAAKCYKYTPDEFFEFFSALGYEVFDLHGTQLTQSLWAEENMAFEFFGGHRDDPRLATARALVDRFWRTIDARPELETWTDCVLHARDPLAYLKQYGW